MKTIINGIFFENPIFVLLLGLCSALAVTTNFENSYLMGICVLIVLTLSNLVVSIIKKMVPSNVLIPVYILIISTIVTILEVLLEVYIKPLYDVLGIYLPLIVVNCIVLGRALSVASKSSIKKSLFDGIGIGLGYTFVLMIIGFIREVLGNNTLTIFNSISSITNKKLILNIDLKLDIFKISLLTKPAGAFLTLAFLIALFNYIKGGKNESN